MELRLRSWESKLEALRDSLESKRLKKREYKKAVTRLEQELAAERDRQSLLDGEVSHYRDRYAQAIERLNEGAIRRTRRVPGHAKSRSVATGPTLVNPLDPSRAAGSNGALAHGGSGAGGSAGRGSSTREQDAGSNYTDESWYERAYPARSDLEESKQPRDSAEEASSTSRRAGDDGFAGTLTDEEYVKVMSAIGIIPEYSEAHLDSVLSKDAARARIEGWFAASPDRVEMGERRRTRVTKAMADAYEKRIAARGREAVKKLLKEQAVPGPVAERAPKEVAARSAHPEPASPTPPAEKGPSPHRSVQDQQSRAASKEHSATRPQSTLEK